MNRYLRFGLILVLTAGCCFAQSSSVGRVIQGSATELIAIARWLGIIVLIICGIGVAAGGTHMMGKIGGAIVGLALALFASPLVVWIQGMG